MVDAVNRYTTFETNAHTAQWTARLAAYRTPETVDPARHDRRGDGCSVFDLNRLIVNFDRDQCPSKLRAGE